MPRFAQRNARIALLLALTLALALAGCNDATTGEAAARRAMAIESADECHLCGMIIGNFPGPKGQLYEQDSPQNLKFCSTRDLFAYLLDPEHRHRIQQVWVHDMARTPWEHPGDDAYIDARQAWFVVGSRRKGGMGPTLASFAQQADADAFAHQYGGRLYRFEQIDLALLSSMGF